MRKTQGFALVLTGLSVILLAGGASAGPSDTPISALLANELILLVVLLSIALWHMGRKAAKAQLPKRAIDAAFERADAAYCTIGSEEQGFHTAPNLELLLSHKKPITQLDQLFTAFNEESALKLSHTVELLRQGKPVAKLFLQTAADTYIECRPAQGKGEGAQAVLWFIEATEQYKQHQRLTQENEKLKTEMKSYSTIINMAPYPIWQRGKNLAVNFYNLSYGEAVEDVSEKTPPSETPELDKRVKSMARMALDSGKPTSERRHIVIGGERKLYQISELPIPEEGITVGFAIDMSEVELLKEDLARHVSAQDDLLESSASAMAIYGADMRLKSFNFSFIALWKLDESWLDTQPTYGEILETLREKRKLPEQANFQLFKQQQIKLFTGLIEPREEFFYLPDGKALRVIAIPHALGGILFAYEDVTDRLALERSYNTLIAVQRETLDNLHEGLAVFGEDGRLRLSNPGFLSMWNIDADFARSEPHIRDVVEKCKKLYNYEDWDSFKQQRIELVQTRDFKAQLIERSDGKVIDWRKVPLPDGATLITFLDITDSTVVERSLLERNIALQEADRLKTEFLANVSYELRSPLTSISGFSEMLKQEYFGTLSDKQKEYVEGIHQSSQHLMQLINDILDLASVEAGYMRLEVSKFDIYAMMKSVLSLIQERAREYNLKVEFECPSKIGKMTADETRIKQILFNLLSNAIKYSEPGDTITLGAKEEGEEHIELWVQDEGEGIPPEEQETIFSKFYKGKNQETGKNAKSPQRSGPGLGLSIVKSFIELHGGKVELHSEPGKGSRFECRLLRHNPNLQPLVKSKKAAAA